MIFVFRIMLLIMLFSCLATPGLAVQSGNSAVAVSQETLQQHVAELIKNPANTALREKIIMLALTMDPAPTVPENVERNLARGTALIRTAAGAGEYKQAIVEFEAAANNAPWLAMAYIKLAVAHEKVGFYTEAIQNFKFYLMAAPEAKNAREVKNKVDELEADSEGLKAGKNSVVPASPATVPVPGKAPAVAGKTALAIEPEKKQSAIKMQPAENISRIPVEQKSKAPSFIGNWYFKDTVRGEELTIQAFGIRKDANGDIVPTAPMRPADYVPTIRAFDIFDSTMKVEIHWRLSSVVGYWKIETYKLTLSRDGTKLTGSYSEKSVGGRNIDLDRTLFRK
jgi:tetratricopeptide (TPR) repeat protein